MDIARRSGWRQLLVAVAVAVGIFAMHGAMFSCAPSSAHATPAAHDTMSNSAHSTASMATSSEASPFPMGPGPATGPTPDGISQLRSAPTTVDMTSPVPATPIGGDHGLGLHGLMNLCLAVLSGLALLVVAVLLWWSVSRPARAAGVLQTQMGRTVLRPPPTAIRLAQLCVLRT